MPREPAYTLQDVAEVCRGFLQEHFAVDGALLGHVTLHLLLPADFEIPLPLPPSAPGEPRTCADLFAPARPADTAPAPPWHSDDFSAARVGADSWTFGPTERDAIKYMWGEWEAGRPVCERQKIRDACGTCQEKISELFRNSGAFKKFVLPVGKDCYRLALPDPPAGKV